MRGSKRPLITLNSATPRHNTNFVSLFCLYPTLHYLQTLFFFFVFFFVFFVFFFFQFYFFFFFFHIFAVGARLMCAPRFLISDTLRHN